MEAEGQHGLYLCLSAFSHVTAQGRWTKCWFLAASLFKAKFQSQPWLWASEKSVHESHGRSAVAPEPAHQNIKEVRGSCERGRLLPVSIPHDTNFPCFPFVVAEKGPFSFRYLAYMRNTAWMCVGTHYWKRKMSVLSPAAFQDIKD